MKKTLNDIPLLYYTGITFGVIDILIAHEIKPIAYTKLAILISYIIQISKKHLLGIVGFLTENLRGTRGWKGKIFRISPPP